MPEVDSKEETRAQGDEERPEKEEADSKEEGGEDSTHDPYYPPIIVLPEVIVNSGEEEEDVLIKIRAKLFRYASNEGTEDPPEWKERGTGDVKILKHRERGKPCHHPTVIPQQQLF